MGDAAPIIQVQSVTKRFGGVPAVNGVTLEIAKGEFFALLGPSGCGKTTLLRMLAGFETPDTGRILIDGQDQTFVPPDKRPTNMVFQSYAVFPHLNVFDNVAYGLRRLGVTGAARQARVEEALVSVQLQGLGNRRPSQLSGGQRQRVALARALILKPKVLLLDEPLAALDKKLREEMQLELRALQRQVGITFLFVTHDQDEALSMADRAAVMMQGRIAQLASPRVLYEEPANAGIADFIGTINLIAAKVTQSGSDGLVLETEGLGSVTLPALSSPPSIAARVTLAIRPEKLFLNAADAPAHLSVQGQLGRAIYLGDRSHSEVHVTGRDKPLMASIANARREPGGVAQGDAVKISFDPKSLLLYPAAH